MSYCVNPSCPQPENPDNITSCPSCGSKLLLRDRYRAIKLIGSGNFSRVLLAADEDRLHTACVIKQFFPKNQKPKAIAKATKLFKQEAEQLCLLGEHPQIPSLLAYFQQDNCLYLVEQFIEGQNLLQELNQEGAFSELKIWELLINILPVLEFVHDRNVVHRDLKPENLLRRGFCGQTPFAKEGDLILIDFGVAAVNCYPSPSQSDTLTGTVGYAPIEQLRGGLVSPASDLYSLGMTCIHLLTEAKPEELFDPYSGEIGWRSHLIQRGQSISKKLGEILDKLVKDLPSDRYQSAAEVLAELPGTDAETCCKNSDNPLILPNLPPINNSTNNSDLDKLNVIASAAVEAWKNLFKNTYFGINKKQNYCCNGESLMLGNIEAEFQQIVSQMQGAKSGSKKIPCFESNLTCKNPDLTNYKKPVKNWECVRVIKGHSAKVNSLAIGPKGLSLVSCSNDKTIKLWNLQTGQLLHRFFGHTSGVDSVAISPDGKRLVSGSSDRTILAWNLSSRFEIERFYSHSGSPYSHRFGAVNAVAFSPDGKIIASGSEDKSIKLWNPRSGELLYKLEGHLDGVLCLSYAIPYDIENNLATDNFNPHKYHTLASGSADGEIKLWRFGFWESLQTLTGHFGLVRAVTFSPDGHILASAGGDGTIKLWSVQTGELLKSFQGHSDEVCAVNISPDGNTLASGSKDGTVKIWDLENWQLINSLRGCDPVVFSPDGETLVTGGEEGEVLIWRMSV
ncbi:MAG: protein kinase [Okeania sp. SIO2H7]|nr:protein kinase [Okeania sp. SIO2H7]